MSQTINAAGNRAGTANRADDHRKLRRRHLGGKCQRGAVVCFTLPLVSANA